MRTQKPKSPQNNNPQKRGEGCSQPDDKSEKGYSQPDDKRGEGCSQPYDKREKGCSQPDPTKMQQYKKANDLEQIVGFLVFAGCFTRHPLIYNVVTLSGMLVMVAIGRRGLQRVNPHWFEHYENLITGLTLVGLAILNFFIEF